MTVKFTLQFDLIKDSRKPRPADIDYSQTRVFIIFIIFLILHWCSIYTNLKIYSCKSNCLSGYVRMTRVNPRFKKNGKIVVTGKRLLGSWFQKAVVRRKKLLDWNLDLINYIQSE